MGTIFREVQQGSSQIQAELCQVWSKFTENERWKKDFSNGKGDPNATTGQ